MDGAAGGAGGGRWGGVVRKLLARAWLGVVYAFLYLPIVVLVVHSFNAHKTPYQWGGWTLHWYRALWENPTLMRGAAHSLLLAVATATLTTLLGTMVAVALHRFRFAGKAVVRGLLFTLMMTPDIVMAISLLALFVAAGVSLGFASLLLAHVTFCLPFVVVTVGARLEGFDPRLAEAARDLGATEWQVVRTILVPLVFPAMMAGWLLGFTLSLDDVVVSMFVSGPSFDILPLRIYSLARKGLNPEINALGTVMLLVSLGALVVSHLLVRRLRSAP